MDDPAGYTQLVSMPGRGLDSVFDLTVLLFQGFWVLGWSVGVLILFLLAVSFLFYGESARVAGDRHIRAGRTVCP